jgi:hypothetical protein
MVPLESVLTKPGSAKTVPGFKLPDRKAPDESPAPPRAHQFKVVDLMSRRVLAEGVSAREAVRALEEVRSVMDVSVSVWDDEDERWRMLSLEERRLLWRHRGQVDPPDGG